MGLDAEGNQVFPDSEEMEGMTLTDDTEVEVEEPKPEVETREDEVVETELEEEEEASEEPESESETESEDESEPKKKKKSFNPEELSKNVQKRINREVRKREELRAEYEAKQQAMAAELSELKSRLDTDKGTQEKQLMESRIRNAQAIHTQLMEDGEYGKASEVLNDITDMKIYVRDLSKTPSAASTAPEEAPRRETASPVSIPEEQINWMKNNTRYNKEAGYTAYVNEVYDALLDEGYAPEDKALYAELDSRLNTPSKPARPKPAPPPNAGIQAPASSKPNKLTKSDLSRMEDWGLDPNDPAARKEFLRNKQL